MSENTIDIYALSQGSTFGPYVIDCYLGRGSTAVVYKARHLENGQNVALKILLPSLSSDPEYLQRFEREGEAVAQLKHPNVAQSAGIGVVNDTIYYMAMEYVDGDNLMGVINKYHHLPIPEVMKIAREIAEGMDYCWTNFHLTHGDIKPDNIMLTQEAGVKVTDFGVARTDRSDTVGEELILTPLYAAPELILGHLKHSDCRADIYSLGATLYHAIAGTPPFQCQNSNKALDSHVYENPEPLNFYYPETPKVVSDFVGKMLQKAPEARPQNWKEVIAEIDEVTKALNSLGKRPSISLSEFNKNSLKRGKSGLMASQEERMKRMKLLLISSIVISVLLAAILLVQMYMNKLSKLESQEEVKTERVKTP